MTGDYIGYGLPGQDGLTSTIENAFTIGVPWQQVEEGGRIAAATIDAGSTPTSVLRPGLLLGKITATKLYTQYDPAATDGSQVAVGILEHAVNTVNPASNTTWITFGRVVLRGYVRAGNLYGLDEQARRQLNNKFMFDDRPNQIPGGPLLVVAKTADYTVVNGTDNETLLTNQGAGAAVVFTLPTTLARGQHFRFFCEAGQTITITAPAGKLVVFNNAAATSIAFSTSAEKIGGFFDIYVNADASKYLCVVGLGAETQTPTIS